MTKIIESKDNDAINFWGGNKEAFQSKDSFVVLVGPADSGKAEFVDNLIPTPNGWRRIGDTKPGNIIFSEQGKEILVDAIFPQGLKQAYNIKFDDGLQIEVCGEHLWEVWTKDQRDTYINPIKKRGRTGNPKVLTTLEIKENLHKRFTVAITKPVEYSKKELLIDPYLIGIIIGDGHIGNSVINVSSADDFIIDKCKSKLKEGITLSKTKSNKYDYEIRYNGNKAEYNQYFRNFGIRIRSNNKFIPKEYLISSIEDRTSLLQGLIDSDGSIDKNNSIYYYTISEQLRDDIVELVNSLGGVCKITSKIPKYEYKEEIRTGQKSYNICIVLPNEITPCSLPRKLEKYKPRQKLPMRKIISVEKTEMKEMICISVNNPTSLYLTKNYLVTHNTFSCCLKMHLFAVKYPGVRILLTRKSLRALRESAVITYQSIIRSMGMDSVIRTLGETRPTNFIYPMAERRENGILYKGKSEIILAPLDTKGKALGAEYNMIYVNQPDTEGTTLEEFKLIRSRARLDTSPYRQLICDPNPAHDKHWLLLNSISESNPNGEWEIINSRHKDNPKLYNHETEEWTELGIEEMNQLSNLPGNLRESLYEGKWFSTAGMAFGAYWQDHKHVLYLESEEAKSLKISKELGNNNYINSVPQDWHHYLAIDWGMDDPFVALLIAHHPTKDLFIIHKHIYLTNKDIYYVSNLTAEMISGYNIKAVIADRGRAESTVMENTLGRTITTAKKGGGSVIDSMNLCIAELNSDRWKFVNLQDSLFHDPDPELIRAKRPMGYDEIPNLKKDDRTGKIADHQQDHFYDAWKYFVRYWVDLNRRGDKNTKFVWL